MSKFSSQPKYHACFRKFNLIYVTSLLKIFQWIRQRPIYLAEHSRPFKIKTHRPLQYHWRPFFSIYQWFNKLICYSLNILQSHHHLCLCHSFRQPEPFSILLPGETLLDFKNQLKYYSFNKDLLIICCWKEVTQVWNVSITVYNYCRFSVIPSYC